jgi:hypothetical protein
MDINRHLEHDHRQIHSLGEDIIRSGTGEGVAGRDNQFDLFDLQLRRHLAVVEEVLFSPLKKEGESKTAINDIKGLHKELRKSLSSLDRQDKGTHEWTAEFRNVLERFDVLAKRHQAIAAQCEALAGAAELSEQYEQAKLKRLGGGHWSWNKVGMGVAGVAGAAAVAGAAYAANRWYQSGRRRHGKAEDDFELRLETDENLRLISSKKVEGTAVVGRDGQSLGTIESFMVDKYSGRVAYAIMSFGGAMGFGQSLFPLPWPLLDYDEENDGYGLDISKEELAAAPRFEPNDQPEFTPEYRRRVLVFYRPSDLTASVTGKERQSAIGGSDRTGTTTAETTRQRETAASGA